MAMMVFSITAAPFTEIHIKDNLVVIRGHFFSIKSALSRYNGQNGRYMRHSRIIEILAIIEDSQFSRRMYI